MANYILIRFTSEKMTNQFSLFAKKHKITLRVLSSYGLKNYIRVTIGTAQEMQIAMKAFNKF
jgi:histidinol-phosphate/aromatic aminotransferase/cobyric acid decarboxylase-like protein